MKASYQLNFTEVSEKMQLQGILLQAIKSRESQSFSRIEPEPSTENSNTDLHLNFTPTLKIDASDSIMTLVWSCEIPLVYYWSASLIVWLSSQGTQDQSKLTRLAEYKKALLSQSMLEFYLIKLQGQQTPYFMSQDSENLQAKIVVFSKAIRENLGL